MKNLLKKPGDNVMDQQKLTCKDSIEIPGVPNILIVDDEKSLTQFISSILTTNGFSSDRVGNLKEAYRAFSRKEYDIVFLDLGLPDGSGFKVLEKAIEISAETLVVMITGVHDLQTAINSIRKGAFDYITKPFTVTLFQDRLKTVIDEWKSRTITSSYQNYLESMVRERTESLNKTVSEIKHVHDTTVIALGAALDLRDPETEDHCKRVSENSVLLGKKLGLKGKKLRDLKWGSYLHDIGKIGIPEKILLKKGPLTEDEMLVVKKHTIFGHSMIKNIDFLADAGVVVLYHHEKFNGTGYPMGLKGENIPLFARIFAVTDAFDAMIVDRPYRKALPLNAVLHEIKKCSGPHFDPDIVKACLQISTSHLQVGAIK